MYRVRTWNILDFTLKKCSFQYTYSKKVIVVSYILTLWCIGKKTQNKRNFQRSKQCNLTNSQHFTTPQYIPHFLCILLRKWMCARKLLLLLWRFFFSFLALYYMCFHPPLNCSVKWEKSMQVMLLVTRLFAHSTPLSRVWAERETEYPHKKNFFPLSLSSL